MPEKIIASPAGDGVSVGYRYMPEDYEPVEGECVVAHPPDPELQVWDPVIGGPRAKTEEEIAQEARQGALERVAAEGASSYASTFVDTNDVVGLLSSLVKRLVQASPDVLAQLAQEEADALAVLDAGYSQGVTVKGEIETTPPDQLDDIHWS